MAEIRFRMKYGKGVLDLTLDERFLKKISDPSELLDRIGLVLVSQIQRGFDQGGLVEKWAPTMVPNVPAIAKRISEGKSVPDRYLGGDKKPLIDTGHLRRSISHKVIGQVLFIGTNVEYGKVHQEGGVSTVESKIPDLLEQGNETAEKAIKKVAKSFPTTASFLRKKRNITVKVKKRPFLVMTQQMQEITMRAVKQWLLEGQ